MAKKTLQDAASTLEALRRILTNVVWILIILVVFATLGRYISHRITDDLPGAADQQITETHIPPPIDWTQVDQELRQALQTSRQETEQYAADHLKKWSAAMMERVDNDFLGWYFSYWTQQMLGIESLVQYGKQWFFDNQPDAAERLTATIQQEFAARVLRPAVAELELERIARDSVQFYLTRLNHHLEPIPAKYRIPAPRWERHLAGIAVTTQSVDGNRSTPLSLKVLTVSGAGASGLLIGKTTAAISKISSQAIVKGSTKTAGAIAVKSGSKAAAKVGTKFLGTLVGIGVLVWDIWDHRQTVAENRPLLRQAIADYFRELQELLLHHPESGLMSIFYNLEQGMIAGMTNPEK